MLENFLGNKTAWKILRILSEAPGKGVTRNEIKALTKAGNLALSNSLKELETYGIIKKKKVGKKDIYWLNMANEFAKKILELFEIERENLKGLSPSKVTYLAKIVSRLERIKPKSIILFGSQVKGIASQESDFDICIIVEKKDRRKLKEISKLPENIQIHIFEEKEFLELKKEKDPLVEEILRDGVKII